MTRISRPEFIALIAMMFATIAFSIDSMLPALPEIGAELSPHDVNRAQLVLTTFVIGMGIGTFFVGPISDTFGRKRVITIGALVYIAAALVAWYSTTLEMLLAARLVQGLGGSAPRIVALAIMRDLFSGRIMARMMSIAMMIFAIFPSFAPLLGSGIIAISSWRGIFLAFVLFATVSTIWMNLRLPESLPVEKRRPFRPALLWSALREMLSHPTVRLSIMVQTLCMALLFTMLLLVQPVYHLVFDRAVEFPYWFAGISLCSAAASILNASLVVRLGMRRMVTASLLMQVVFSGVMLLASGAGTDATWYFALFVVWQASVFFIVGTTLGNLNAIAMEPMGHIAGMAASVIGAIATVASAALATPIGLLFNGSILPLPGGIFVFSGAALLLMLRMGRIESRLPV